MRRIPALDGLRGVAILLVVVYHGWPDLLQGGAYGVPLFFVLSGYLITTILTRSDRVDFRRFYVRRAARLLPALVMFLAGWWLLSGVWSWHPLTYTANYAWISGGGSFGLAHMWSLSVEEHFYLVWPLIVAITPRRWIIPVTVGLLAAGLVWRLVMLPHPFVRVMWGTDTAAFAILAGCLVAVTGWRPPARWGLPSVVGIVVFAVVTPAWTTGYLVVELVVVGLAAVAVAVCATAPVRVLEVRPLVWFGTLAYGLYLWHGALLYQWSPVVAVAVSVAFAWLSWVLVEQRVLNWSGRFPRQERSHRRSVVITGKEPNSGRATSQKRSTS